MNKSKKYQTRGSSLIPMKVYCEHGALTPALRGLGEGSR